MLGKHATQPGGLMTPEIKPNIKTSDGVYYVPAENGCWRTDKSG
jgi:hypothetical protein